MNSVEPAITACISCELGDQDMLERWQTLDDLPSGERQRILDVLDSLIRDAQARIAYAKPG